MNKAKNDPIMKRVIGLMEDKRIRWADIGAALKMTPQRLYNWRAKGRIPPDQLPALADLFGCTIDYLMRGTLDEKARYQSPPNVGEWSALPLKARVFVMTLIHLILLGAITGEDVDFLENMTNRMASSRGGNSPNQSGNGARGGWIVGGPDEQESEAGERKEG